ncbi:MAG TPA: tetratricopeptide repeat protein, partial [Casimicrobiaceae bacterium]|nr:tetratricopeptide repeat protein [Casimicrobiaceae bacterium]
LEGVNVGDRFERVADLWKGKLEDEAGYYAFNDVHAMMSFAATNRSGEIARLRRAMRNAVKGDGSNAAMTREVGLPLADGLLAFSKGHHVDAIQAIEPVRDIAGRFGGSHAQRDLLTLTMIDASMQAGDHRRARHYIAERTVHKPTAWSVRLSERSERARRVERTSAVDSLAAMQ